jgi:hypothetical protein
VLRRGDFVVAWIGWTRWWYTKTGLTSQTGTSCCNGFGLFPTAGLVKERCRTHTKIFGGIELTSTESDAAREA